MAQGVDLLSLIKESMELKEVDIRTYSPLSLAYIGDSIYDLVIRSYVVGLGNTSNQKLHKESTKYVKAQSQAKIIEGLMDSLDEEEKSVYRRGKNAKPSSSAKNATLAEYLKATGFEALLGYLYLSGKTERMMEIIKRGIDIINNG